MYANYHTHTYRCMHAAGQDFEYVEKAIESKIKVLGFSDHCPTIYKDEKGFSSYYKMAPEEAPEYFSSIRALSEKYGEKIELHAGFEAEFLSDTWEDSFELWKKLSPEYLILGQHYIDYEIRNGHFGDHTHSSRLFGDVDYASRDRLKRYVDGVVAGMSSDVFSCLAHPDLVTFTGEVEIYREEMLRLIKASKKYDVPLEFNLLGYREKRGYPRLEFWELAASEGCSAILGCDAHDPGELCVAKAISDAESLLESLGVEIIKTIELRNPFVGKK